MLNAPDTRHHERWPRYGTCLQIRTTPMSTMSPREGSAPPTDSHSRHQAGQACHTRVTVATSRRCTRWISQRSHDCAGRNAAGEGNHLRGVASIAATRSTTKTALAVRGRQMPPCGKGASGDAHNASGEPGDKRGRRARNHATQRELAGHRHSHWTHLANVASRKPQSAIGLAAEWADLFSADQTPPVAG